MAPTQCGECGKEIAPESVSCPHCGAAQSSAALSIAPSREGAPSPFRKPAAPPRPQEPQAAPLETLDDELPPPLFTPMRGLLALGTLLLLVILWYGITSRPSSEKPRPRVVPAPASSPTAPAPSQSPPVAALAVPRLTPAERQAAADVLEVLKTLQSITSTDVAYQDYRSRVLNTKIQVETYLQAESGDPAMKDRVYEAMTLHLLAVAAWDAKMVNRQSAYESVGTHPALSLCPDIHPLLDLPPSTGVSETPAMNRGVNLAASLDRLWACADNKIADVERTLKARSAEARP